MQHFFKGNIKVLLQTFEPWILAILHCVFAAGVYRAKQALALKRVATYDWDLACGVSVHSVNWEAVSQYTCIQRCRFSVHFYTKNLFYSFFSWKVYQEASCLFTSGPRPGVSVSRCTIKNNTLHKQPPQDASLKKMPHIFVQKSLKLIFG